MSEMLECYLDRIMIYAKRSARQSADIRSELRDHLLNRIEQFQGEGVSEVDATHRAITAMGHPRVVGYGLRDAFPLVDIRSKGTARGIIAIGPRAIGVFAFGGSAAGVVAFGGLAAGVVCFSGLGLGLLFCFGLCAFGGFSSGVIAVGLMARGAVGVGLNAMGGCSIGLLADGALVLSRYTQDNAPNFLKNLAVLNYSKLYSLFQMLTIPLIVLIVGALAVVSGCESRRITRADPWLQS